MSVKLEDMFQISEYDWYVLQMWAEMAYTKDKNEISGLLTAVPDKDGIYTLGDVEILKQENSGSNTELDGDAVAEYKVKYAMMHKNPNMKFVWWHSHHTMDAFWSGTDLKEIDAWENDSFSLALVINLREEYKFRISVWNAGNIPIEQHFDTTLNILREDKRIKPTKKDKELYEELCSDKHQVTTWNRGGYINYNYGGHNQMNLGENIINREKSLIIEKRFENAVEKLEEAIDAFMDSSLTLKALKEKVTSMNKICTDNKLPFSIDNEIFKGNKQMVLNTLMSTLPMECFNYENVETEMKLTGGFGYHGGWGWQ